MPSDLPVGPMQVLTVWQPWATALVLGPKDVENRSPRWSWLSGRCPFLLAVHAAARPVFGRRDVLDSALMEWAYVADRWPVKGPGGIGPSVRDAGWPRRDPPKVVLKDCFPRSAILGVVEVVAAVPAEQVDSRWAAPGRLGLVTGARWVLPAPLPHVGRQGIGKLPDDVAARVRAEAVPWREASWRPQ